MVRMAKSKAAEQPAAAAAPKLTMMSFFLKAPAATVDVAGKGQLGSAEGLAVPAVIKAKGGAEPLKEQELEQRNAVCIDGGKHESGRSDSTPQRPTNFSMPSPSTESKEKRSGGERSEEQLKGEGKVVNLTLGKFDAVVDKDDDDCVMIMSSPEEAKKESKTSGGEDSASGCPAGKAKPSATAPKASKSPSAGKAARGASKAASGDSKKAADSPAQAPALSIKRAFASCTNFFKPAEKKEIKTRERPAHPIGAEVKAEEDLLMVAQFLSSFSDALGIEAMSAQELHRDLNKPHPSPTLCDVHVALLVSIVKGGETPDEVRMIDADTWPSVLREHLEDTRASDCSAVRDLLASYEYAYVTPNQRLQTLCLLVDDCLQAKQIRKFVDDHLAQIDTYHREQQLEEIGDKYQKKQSEGGGMAAFVVAETEQHESVEGEDEEMEEGARTERQKNLVKHKEEKDRVGKIEEEKRQKKMFKLEEEEDRRRAEQNKQRKLEERARGLIISGDIVRVPTIQALDGGDDVGYYVMDCWSADGERQLMCRRVAKDAGDKDAAKWSAIEMCNDADTIVERWSPLYPENDRGFQKRLREMMPTYVPAPGSRASLGASKEATTIDLDAPDCKEEGGDKAEEEGKGLGEGGEACRAEDPTAGEAEEGAEAGAEAQEMEVEQEEQEDPVALALARSKEVVMDLEARTPENIFTDHNAWRGKRMEWSELVLQAYDTALLAAALTSFETELKRAKMQEGWDEVRVKWLRDTEEAKTCAGVNYLVKQLKVYIGKEKARPGKLASVFQGGARTTRSMEPKEPTRRSSRQRRVTYTEASEEEEEEEEEAQSSDGGSVVMGDDSDFDPDADEEGVEAGRGSLRRVGKKGFLKGKPAHQVRKSQRSSKGQKAAVVEDDAPRKKRGRTSSGASRITRSTRSSAAVSYKEDVSDSADSDE